jgi:hypothetical protein
MAHRRAQVAGDYQQLGRSDQAGVQMMNSLHSLVGLACICSLAVDPASTVPRDANPVLAEPLKAFEHIPETVCCTALSKGNNSFVAGGHWQGIQTYYHDELKRQICFLSRDSRTRAYFVTATFKLHSPQFGAIRHVQGLPSDGQQPPLRHAGGIQLIGDYLVIGVEDNQHKRRSQIQFWDVSRPFFPRLRSPLTIKRQSTIPKDMTAGAVGIVRCDRHHVLVVANWDARDLDIYRSNGLALSDDACRFSLARRWSFIQAQKQAWQPNRAWESYQAINLIADRSSKIYLLGFATDATGRDVIDLFSLDLHQDSPRILQKISRKRVKLQEDAHFRSAGGISIRSATELNCCASQYNGQDTVIINMSPSAQTSETAAH